MPMYVDNVRMYVDNVGIYDYSTAGQMCNIKTIFRVMEVSVIKQLVLPCSKDLMQGKVFQRCRHLLYCSVLSLGGNVNTSLTWDPFFT